MGEVHSGGVGSILLCIGGGGAPSGGRGQPITWGRINNTRLNRGGTPPTLPPLWETLLLLIPLFQPRFYPMITIFCFFHHCFSSSVFNYGSSLRICIRMKIFLLFTIVYSKIKRNVLKAV